MMDHHDGYSRSHDKHPEVADIPDSWGIAAWIAVLALGAMIGGVVVALWLT